MNHPTVHLFRGGTNSRQPFLAGWCFMANCLNSAGHGRPTRSKTSCSEREENLESHFWPEPHSDIQTKNNELRLWPQPLQQLHHNVHTGDSRGRTHFPVRNRSLCNLIKVFFSGMKVKLGMILAEVGKKVNLHFNFCFRHYVIMRPNFHDDLW